jgi:hypothetical protein
MQATMHLVEALWSFHPVMEIALAVIMYRRISDLLRLHCVSSSAVRDHISNLSVSIFLELLLLCLLAQRHYLLGFRAQDHPRSLLRRASSFSCPEEYGRSGLPMGSNNDVFVGVSARSFRRAG